jgi:type VI secretion system protein ImpK
MLRIGSAPAPSLHFFQVYTGILLDTKREVLESAPTDAVAAEARPGGVQPSHGGVEPEATDASAVAEMATLVGRPQAIWNRLAVLLEQQLMEAARLAGPIGLEFHREAVYVMAALTDEMFLHLDWEGKEFWLGHLLEAKFFQSHLAGEQFFRRIDQLLMRDDEPAAEIAAVYLSALALGFRGRYRATPHQNTIDGYRNRLFSFIARREPELTEHAERLFPQAYRNTLGAGALPRLPNPRRWWLALGGAVVAWLLVAQIGWHNVSSELQHRLCCLRPGCTEACGVSPSKK